MKNYKKVFNERTGVFEYLFHGKLLKISETTLENSNGKSYKIVNINFDLPSGENVERLAICYESNYEYGIEVGKTYLCSLSFDAQNQPYLRMSHIDVSGRATVEDFAELLAQEVELEEEPMSV